MQGHTLVRILEMSGRNLKSYLKKELMTTSTIHSTFAYGSVLYIYLNFQTHLFALLT